MRWFKIVVFSLIGICALSSLASAQSKKKPKSESIQVAKPKYQLTQVLPTMSFGEGSVGSYFFPANQGTEWTLRTISSLIGPDNQVVKSDTAMQKEWVIATDHVSLQGLPILVCAGYSYRPGRDMKVDTIETEYYVDDSVIMAVFNNSIYSGQNRALLSSPLRIGTQWRENPDDSAFTVIASMGDTVVVPYGKFTNTIATVTTLGHGLFAKFFVPGVGIAKAVFQGTGPGGQGRLLVTTELVDLKKGTGELPKIKMQPVAQPVPDAKKKAPSKG